MLDGAMPFPSFLRLPNKNCLCYYPWIQLHAHANTHVECPAMRCPGGLPSDACSRDSFPAMLDARGSFPAMLDARGSFPAMLDSRDSSQRCLMPFLAMLDPEVLPMQRSLPSVGSLAHTTSRTTRTENPARCRLLDARLHDYTTPNTTRRPTQHDAQHNTTPNTPRSTERNPRSATHVCRQPA